MTLARPNWRPARDAPPEVSAAILRGDSRLKAIRKWRDRRTASGVQDSIGQGYLSILKVGAVREHRDHCEARAGFECSGGVAFIGDIAARIAPALVTGLAAIIGLLRRNIAHLHRARPANRIYYALE